MKTVQKSSIRMKKYSPCKHSYCVVWISDWLLGLTVCFSDYWVRLLSVYLVLLGNVTSNSMFPINAVNRRYTFGGVQNTKAGRLERKTKSKTKSKMQATKKAGDKKLATKRQNTWIQWNKTEDKPERTREQTPECRSTNHEWRKNTDSNTHGLIN